LQLPQDQAPEKNMEVGNFFFLFLLRCGQIPGAMKNAQQSPANLRGIAVEFWQQGCMRHAHAGALLTRKTKRLGRPSTANPQAVRG